MKTIVLDGERLLVPTASEWVRIASAYECEGVGIPRLLNLSKMVELSRTHALSLMLTLSLRKGGRQNYWAPTFLFMSGENLFRVRLVHTKCPQCFRIFEVADLNDPTLYECTDAPTQVAAKAAELPVLTCPNCASKFDRRLHPIYVVREIDDE